MPWPGDEGEERWHHAWQAIKKVAVFRILSLYKNIMYQSCAFY